MKNFYHKKSFSKIYLVLFIFLTFGQFALRAQQYYFTAVNGTFKPLSGANSISTIQDDDVISPSINIGFNFTFKGKVYTKTRVSSNGFLSFRIGDISSSFYSSDTSFIAPLGDDLGGYSGTASYKTEGTAPNRVFTVEWLNWRWRYTATSAVISFQVKLYETINRIEFIYRQESGAISNSYANIGLSFQTLNNYMFLSNSSNSPVVETTMRPTILTKPVTGQIYRFDTNIFPEPSNHATAFSNVSAGILAVKWTDAIGTELPTRYLIKVSNVSFAAITNPVDGVEAPVDLNLNDGTGAVYCGYGSQAFNGWTDSLGNTTYYMKIFPMSNGGANSNYKTDGTIPQLQLSVPVYEARNLSLSNCTANSMTLNWKRGSGSKCIVFVKESASGKSEPLNNNTYAANAAYGSGGQLGSTGWFCVYNGTGNTVNVSGLKPYTSYAVHVLEYNGAAGAEQYSTADEITSYNVYKTNLFNDIGTSFAGLKNSAVAWCDYDNDGDLDFIASGSTASARSTILYRNNGIGAFANSGVVFPDVNYSSVSWGDYDNDGFADLVISGLNASSVRIAKVYHNNGNGTFSELTTAGLTGINAGNVVWGDYNNDGFADILLSGSTGSGIVSKIYLNNKVGSFYEQEGIKLPGVDYSSCIWSDLDNDEDLDILLTGYTGSNYITSIYRNDGKNSFVAQTGLSFPQISNSSVDVADYDNDGDLDILLTGNNTSGSNFTKIFRNNGKMSFQDQTTITFTGLNNSSAKWGDIDNDGDMDILATGTKDNKQYSKIYLNKGDNTFIEDTALAFPGVDYGSVAWADYDNDNDLDLLLTGQSASGLITKVYRNEITLKNQISTAPTGLISTVDNKVALKWLNINSATTPAKGLSYNIRIGKTSGAYDIVSPLSSPTGFRRVASLGNAQLDTVFVLENIKKGTYYWSVQAIDNNYAGGPFAAEQTFVYNTDIASNSLFFKNNTSRSVKCIWNRGNGDKCVLFVKENGSNTAVPANNTTYIANTSFGSGTQIESSGWYCVYNGDKDSVTVGNLKPNTSYLFHVVEYTGTAGNEVYYTSVGIGNPVSNTTSLFSLQNSITMPGASYGKADWGDYDNDGYLDLIYIGEGTSRITKIYHNNRNNTFTELAHSLPATYSGSVAWGDYDNDGDLDILLTGYSTTAISKVFRNNNGVFVDQTQIVLTGVTQSSADWGDYDNDGYLDIILSGTAGSTPVTKIYRNTGNNNFVEQTQINLRGLDTGSVAWGDYDNDGFLDILLTGGGSGIYTEIYRNNGNNTFTNVANSVEDVWRSCGIWGDYDNDGDLDILVAGAPNTVTKIYTNNGNGTFTYDAGTGLSGISLGTVAWGDYDNDGDLDILVSGYDQTFQKMQFAKVFRNNGNKTFTEQTNMSIEGISEGKVIWGDYDNDKDLDVFVCGSSSSGTAIAKLYKNELTTPNNVPAAPAGLTSSLEGDKLILKWKSVRTDETPYPALSYNVRIGSGPGKADKTGIMANDTVTKPNAGYRRVVRMGNAQLDTTFSLKNLKKGTYYWSVQAIDNSFAGGTFAPEQTFVFNVDVQASSVNAVFKNLTSAKCSWVRGNGDNCIVFAKENGTGTAVPENNITYNGTKVFGTGTQIGTTGWYCVYNGDKDTATISGLKAATEYTFQVIEYSGIAGAEVYYTTAGVNNPVQYLPPFSEQTHISLTGVSGHTNAWGDYDNDGDLDIILGGNTGTSQVVELYKNNGDNSFTKSPATFDVSTVYDILWGDYDNDNDLDLLILSSFNSKVFENKGDGTFPAKANLADVFMGKGQWADFDNDGFKDIIFTGSGGTKVYKNNHDGTFTIQTHTLPTVSNYSAVACGDYDNDGDLDVLLAGLEGSTAITKVYKNDGNFSFAEQTTISNLPGISNCSVNWADMDNDGDLDIVLAGADYNFATKIFDNNGNNSFSEITGTNFKELNRTSIAIGDYDNDGDRDLLVSGTWDDSDYYTILYQNTGNKTYAEVKTVSFPGIQYGALNWGDYDNDNDLDLFICGKTATGRISKIFRNNGSVFNTKPYTVGTPSYSLNGNDLKITWNKPSDAKTASAGLSYNLYVYETSKSGFVKSGEAFPNSHIMNGSKLVASFGDIQYSSAGYTIKGLTVGDYKFSIQAVDAGMLGGSFSTENSCSIFDLSSVSINVASSYIINTKSGMQYSINSTNGVDGTWINCYGNQAYVNFSPGGFDVWIRQADNTTNKRKLMTIAPQSAAPAFTINYEAETTVESIPANVEYSYSSSFWNISTGADAPVNLTPGNTLYLRTKATASILASSVQNLVIPARPATPAFAIDFSAERTTQNIPSTVEYSTFYDISNATSGTGDFLALTAGQTLYFRTKATTSAFKSAVQTLWVPARPSAPSFSIDYSTETTSQVLSSAYEYALNPEMSGAITGNDTKVTVTPGENLYIRTKSTSSSFSSAVQKLTSPPRPATPSYTIDFINETISGYITAYFEYSRNQDMSNSTTGDGSKVLIVPGEKVYIRVKATPQAFKSLIQTLEVPARPTAPTNLITEDGANTFDWDFVPGFTELSDYHYSTDGGAYWTAVNSKPMNIANMNVSAGNLKLRVRATSTRFKGEQAASTLSFTTEIMKLEEAGIKMYPNPVTDIIHIENLQEKSTIFIFNMNGKLIIQKQVEEAKTKISVSDLPQGLYVLKIQTPLTEYQSKFTKQ